MTFVAVVKEICYWVR